MAAVTMCSDFGAPKNSLSTVSIVSLSICHEAMGPDAVIFTVRDTKRTFHAKMGTIKDRNGMDLRETEDIKKKWQK